MLNRPIEYYDFGITREWIEDNRIVVITTQGDMSRAAVDTWADLVIDTASNWEANKPVFLLHDLSSRDQGLTPYSRERADQTYDAVKSGTEGCIAVVVREGVINRLISLLYFRHRKERGMNLQERLFITRPEAESWLREMLRKMATQTIGAL